MQRAYATAPLCAYPTDQRDDHDDEQEGEQQGGRRYGRAERARTKCEQQRSDDRAGPCRLAPRLGQPLGEWPLRRQSANKTLQSAHEGGR